MPREMTREEATSHVVGLLQQFGALTTRQFELMARSTGQRCPDGTVKFLMQLRLLGTICGGVSVEQRGWVWWLQGEQPPPVAAADQVEAEAQRRHQSAA